MFILKWFLSVLAKTFVVLAVIAGLVFLFIGSGMSAELWECQGGAARCAAVQGTNRVTITDTARRELFDLYQPYPGARIQIRNPEFLNNEILGYIEPSGRITNLHRQELGNIDGLFNR